MAHKRWLIEFSKPGVEVLITSRSNHYPLILNNEDHRNGKARRRVFRYEVKWALKNEGEQTIG